jgi:Flp pilus assembly protein TadG
MTPFTKLLWSNSEGAVAPTVALSLVALIAVGGVALDYARMATMDSELQNAADQAALAAASQLDGEPTACARAVAAAKSLVANQTLLANDSRGLAVTVADTDVCSSDTVIVDNASSSVRFFQDKAATLPATDNTEARFVEVTVNSRKASFALTAIVGALTSGEMSAKARAGMGTALCKVPPLMLCNPSPGVAVDWDAMRGRGLKAVSQAAWAPGGFGYIGPQDANSTQKALAFQNPVFDCQGVNPEEPVSTGSPTPAITAINTRMDIYDISNGGGSVLAPCLGGACPAALDVTKDLVRAANASGNNACKINNNGWKLPTNRFVPRAHLAGDGPMTPIDADGRIDAMGLPRDDCHYTPYNSPCPGGPIGDGKWARGDYFNKYHAGRIPANAATMTRYETYLWEIANGYVPNVIASGSGATALRQNGSRVCSTGALDPTRDRRVLQIAVGENCAALHGASTPVQVSGWISAFLVEPGVPPPGRGNGDSGNEIYLEIIGSVNPGGAAAQIVRRDTPYLVK